MTLLPAKYRHTTSFKTSFESTQVYYHHEFELLNLSCVPHPVTEGLSAIASLLKTNQPPIASDVFAIHGAISQKESSLFHLHHQTSQDHHPE